MPKASGWFANINLMAGGIILVVFLTLTKIFAPEAADWILTPIMYIVDIIRDLGGS